MAEELAAEITSIEDAIKAEMTARDTDEMTVDVFKIRWTRVTSNRFDTTAFKKHMLTYMHSTRNRRKAAVSPSPKPQRTHLYKTKLRYRQYGQKGYYNE